MDAAAILMNAVSNVAPVLIAGLYDKVSQGALIEAREMHSRLWPLNKAVFFDTNPIPIKYMMKRLNIISHNYHRLPMVPASEETERRLDKVLEQTNLLGSLAA